MSILQALSATGLEAIFVGNAAAAMQGVPVTTQDVDLLVRDTPTNREKIERFCAALGLAKPVSVGAFTQTETILGGPWPVDLVFDRLSGGLEFASIHSRCREIPIGDVTAKVASLADIIRSKEAANRAKDAAVLPMLRDALRVIEEIEKQK